MRWLRFMSPHGPRYGVLHGQDVHEVEGDPFTGHELTQRTLSLDDIELLVPVVPTTFYCAGLNYADHITDPTRIPKKPDIGYRSNSALIASGQDVVMPRDATKVQYEGELAAVIGMKGYRIAEEDALSYVFGYTIGNDVSERNWQKEDRTLWRAKSTDTFKPMGPWIDTDADLSTMQTSIFLNGSLTMRFKTDHMIFGVAKFISAISQYVTLQPGDVIWMGTDGKSPDLRDGDFVEIEISGIGRLKNRFVREKQ